jgi:hypothetical protein
MSDIGELSQALYDTMAVTCPDCYQNFGYYNGPRGGAAINVFCRNPECRSGFNIMPLMRLAQRIGKCTIPYPGDPDYDGGYKPPDNPDNRFYCLMCEDLTPHEHWHDTAHGIAETHMVGSERFVCKQCGRTTHRNDEGWNHFKWECDL